MPVETAEHSSAAPAEVEPGEGRRSPLSDVLALVLLGSVSAIVAIHSSRPVYDPDTWWHLRLGQEFRGPWSLADPGSLTPFATRPWFATQWLLEVVASYVQQAFGLAGIAWLSGVGVVVLTVAIYVACRQRASVLLAASMAASLALCGTSLSDGPRLQVASFVLLAVFMTAWLRTMDDLRPRWWLVPLSWLWACTHGMWFMGLLVGFLVVAGLALDRRLTRRDAVRLALVPLGGLVAAALTPVGPKLLLAPLATSKMAWFITEWQPPKFLELVPAIAALTVALVVVTWARGGTRRSWSEILLLAMAAGWIVLYYRTIAVGAVIAAPLLAGAIQSWLPAERRPTPRWERWAGLGMALAIVVGLGIAAPYRGTPPLEEMGRMNAALRNLPNGTVVFNSYELGGWLEWDHRNVVPVVDGLTDAYHVPYVAHYMDAIGLEPGWRKTIDKTGAEYAMLQSGTSLPAALSDTGHWKPVVRQSGYVLLRRTAPTT